MRLYTATKYISAESLTEAPDKLRVTAALKHNQCANLDLSLSIVFHQHYLRNDSWIVFNTCRNVSLSCGDIGVHLSLSL